MSDGKNNGGSPPPDDQRTVFIPSQAGGTLPGGADDRADESPEASEVAPDETPAEESPGNDSWGDASSPWPQSPEDAPGEEEATRFEARPEPGAAEWSAPPPPPGEAPAEPAARMPTAAPVVPRDNAQGIQVGDVLNHIFEVKRFIARGGMGEVFEGCNVNSDEKVAIKVMLPSLAADPNVISMFRREARALTRLQHEALVQYRVLAQEPQLGVLYIVTEYIDGVPLSEVLGKLNPSPEELAALLRRLAGGLRAAHALGVLHRDMSPDNVLLESGRLSGAKIIDFGIAKDLDPGSATIIGEGFAGKLSYVAPEQLGDFGREVGPWSDVYSLALVILAIAMGRDVQMGGTLVDAVDKRRAGPDLTSVPDSLRPVLEMMLRPNPAERLRSMDEVIAALEGLSSAGAGRAAGHDDEQQPSGIGAIPKPALIGGAAALALLVAGGIWIATSGGDEASPAGGQATGAPVSASDNPVQAARQAIDAVIPSVTCSWLDIADVRRDGGQLSVSMGGVAGSPSAAQNEIASALSAAGMASANLDFSQVATISPGGCAAIDTYRQFRNTEAPRIATEQRIWEMRKQEPGKAYEGQEAANMVAALNIGDPAVDLTLLGIEPSGVITPMLERIGGKKSTYFEAGAPPVQGWDDAPITETGNDRYRIEIDLDHEGWSGLVLITGKGPFPAQLVHPPLGARNMAWREEFSKAAARQGWKADMTWFKAVNQRPGD